jgi:histidinol-phosphate aminotransferase
MKNNFFSPALSTVSNRIATSEKNYRLLLDKNEQSLDVPAMIKQKMMASLMETNLNRYPSANLTSLEEKVADYCGLGAENIALAPGSASIITTLLNYFAINGKRIIINQPSYSLFEYHCNTYNIPYEPWMLNCNLQFDVAEMPTPDANSVVIITSPNNPVGNAIRPLELEQLLTTHPETLFILDAVYCEFGENDYTPWVNQYSNLLVLRSFSKAFPVAGIRLGYLCAQPAMVGVIKKLLLPFSINALTQIFAEQVLFDPCFMEDARSRVRSTILERERLYRFMRMYFDAEEVKVYPSQGNFLLISFAGKGLFEKVTQYLEDARIKVLSTHGQKMLDLSIRVTIGTPNENDILLEAMVEAIQQEKQEFIQIAA